MFTLNRRRLVKRIERTKRNTPPRVCVILTTTEHITVFLEEVIQVPHSLHGTRGYLTGTHGHRPETAHGAPHPPLQQQRAGLRLTPPVTPPAAGQGCALVGPFIGPLVHPVVHALVNRSTLIGPLFYPLTRVSLAQLSKRRKRGAEGMHAILFFFFFFLGSYTVRRWRCGMSRT